MQTKYLKNSIEENKKIFVSCFNNDTKAGGIYLLENNSLLPIFEETGCYGIFVDKINKILFCATRIEPQIIAYRIMTENKFKRISIKFTNYEFANDVHGIWILNSKLYVVGAEGEKNGQLCINDDGPGKFVGKVIISEIEQENNFIHIKNSRIYNPFNCSHHHHINDLCMIENKIYISSFSYCDSNKNYIGRGVISVLDELGNAKVLMKDFEQPHSITSYKDRLYLCSSSKSEILSFNPDEKIVKLEHKGVNAFVRGLLVTEKFLYYGISSGSGRTGSKFTNKDTILFRLDESTQEIKRFSMPSFCDNLYSLDSD